MPIFSPNMLKTYEECSEKYRLKYIEKISLPQNSKFFEKGKKIHALANYYLQGFDIEKLEKPLNTNEKADWQTLKNNKYLKMQVINTEYNLSCKIDKFWIGGRLDALVCEQPLTLPSPPRGEGIKAKRFYSQSTLNQAIELRKKQTATEEIMWFLLRDRRFCDLKFRRQAPIGKYIADFVCFEKKLIIELDGSGHFEQKQIEHDNERTLFLEKEGYTMLRFDNNQISNKLSEILEKIYLTLAPWGRGQGEGCYYILDYKTGKIPKGAETDFQTITYLLGMEKFLKQKQGYDSLKFVYIGLKENEEKVIELNNENKILFEEKVLKTCQDINSNVFSKNKSRCEFCEYKKLCF